MTKIQCIVDDFSQLKKSEKYSDTEIRECLKKFHNEDIEVSGDDLHVNGIFYFKYRRAV